MEYLFKFYHKSSDTEYREEVAKRKSTPSKVDIDFFIKQFNGPNKYQLYFIPTLAMMKKIELITKRDNKLQKQFEILPDSAKLSYNMDLIIDELFSTNDLEGVRSTREEIAVSVRSANEGASRRTGRFGSMANSYWHIMFKNLDLPKTPEDIRKIYDNIAADEIEGDEQVDGELFRIDGVDVMSSAERVIHKGILGHEKIILALERMLSILNDNEDIPSLIKVAVSHYIFGYIHPFYDGNGRTSRFINSLYLSKSYSRLTAISLSRSINNNSKNYYDSFKKTNSSHSQGELNEFIDTFLDYIIDGQEIVKDDLQIKIKLLDNAAQKLEEEARLKGLDERYYDIMFMIAQNYFFTVSNEVTVKDVAKHLDITEITSRKILKELVELNLIETNGIRPVYYSSKPGYFDFD